MGSDPLVIHTEVIAEEARSWLAERTELVASKPGEDVFEERASEVAGLLVRTYTEVDAELLDRMPALRVVGRAGVGIDNIDVPACRKRGVEVVYTPDANTQAVAEYVLALVCDGMRPRTCLTHSVDSEEWASMRKTYRAQRQLDEATIGILGLGRIGQVVSRMMRGIGCRVIYHDLEEKPEELRHGATPVDPEELFEQSNILTIHVDGRPENDRWVNQKYIRLLQHDAILLNTSRGFVLDSEDLQTFLKAHPDAKGYLDVYHQEPPEPDDPIFELANAHISPHLASRTETGMRRMSDVVEDIWTVLEGKNPRWPAP
jgi:phosphoglycerate dehydrogenase-like enzyme